jgi:hypothetical protein
VVVADTVVCEQPPAAAGERRRDHEAKLVDQPSM